MSSLLHKSSVELTADQEKIEADKLGDSYFMTQKLAGKLPGLVSTIRHAILAKHDLEKGSLTISIKNHNNTIRGVKSVEGSGDIYAASNICDYLFFKL